ncbi:hypothetical protein NQZ68_025583 [Dissostichus eleginoides]|uniref:Protein NRT1/ PTR FAMILY 2.4 n=1 Tax=Dissostichus eleginoides TaxID=100907 RepID=A0AAD9C5W4_DISEL|nr:hypothetical protein NQZ68_025583 [Dissostichus eleginoides]KAK1895496.1 Protein NRT1/ PTR FAMILY 2.4 [Dissostichus eleginoides]
MAAEARDNSRDMAALLTIGNQLATITAGTNMDSSSTASTTATRSIVRVLVRATVRRHTRVSYIRLDGSHDEESEGETAFAGTAAPGLLLRSELSFVMSSSVLLPSPSHNYG